VNINRLSVPREKTRLQSIEKKKREGARVAFEGGRGGEAIIVKNCFEAVLGQGIFTKSRTGIFLSPARRSEKHYIEKGDSAGGKTSTEISRVVEDREPARAV